jgi:hypothetical protein
MWSAFRWPMSVWISCGVMPLLILSNVALFTPPGCVGTVPSAKLGNMATTSETHKVENIWQLRQVTRQTKRKPSVPIAHSNFGSICGYAESIAGFAKSPSLPILRMSSGVIELGLSGMPTPLLGHGSGGVSQRLAVASCSAVLKCLAWFGISQRKTAGLQRINRRATQSRRVADFSVHVN